MCEKCVYLMSRSLSLEIVFSAVWIVALAPNLGYGARKKGFLSRTVENHQFGNRRQERNLGLLG